MSRINRPPLSLSRLAALMKGKVRLIIYLFISVLVIIEHYFDMFHSSLVFMLVIIVAVFGYISVL